MQIVAFNGWGRNARLSNGKVELIVTLDVGPRVIRYGYIGGRNVFAELAGQQGGANEADWMLRGGHRLWVAPEAKPDTYELDNAPLLFEEIPNGIRTLQPQGPLTRIAKTMEITLAPDSTAVTVVHTLRNAGRKSRRVAPWALSVMAPGGMAVIPLPAPVAHTARLTHNQEWSIWPYTDLADPRWTWGSRYILFRQDRKRGPAKLGIAHREGWVGYVNDATLFVKRFAWVDGAVYPDGGVNFETFSNEDFLEVETLAPLVNLAPGRGVSHTECWELHRDVGPVATEADADRIVRPLASAI